MFTWCTKEDCRDGLLNLDYFKSVNGLYGTEYDALKAARRHVPEDRVKILYVEG